jgi:hypothetical protein
MAKFEQPFEDTKGIFDSLILNANLDRYVTIEVLVNNRLKEIYKPTKTNDLTKYKTGVDVFLVINEKVFDQLSDVQKVIVADEAISGIHYDSEKEKLTISKTDFTTYSGISANRVIKLNIDGTIDNTFNSGTGFNNNVSYGYVIWNNKLLFNGSFTSYNGIPSNGTIILNSDGSIHQTFSNQYPTVFSIGGKLYGQPLNQPIELLATYP